MSSVYTYFRRRFFWPALIGIGLMLLAQLLGRHIWQLELITHYLPHLALLLLITSIFYRIDDSDTDLRKKRSPKHVFLPMIVVYFATGISIALCLMPWYLLVPQHHRVTTSSALTIAYQNVNINNATPTTAIAELSLMNPDVMILIEAGGAHWQASLSQLDKHYPTHCGVNDNSPFAMHVYTRGTQAKCEILTIEDVPLAKLTVQDGRIVYAAHPPPPINESMLQARNDYLKALAVLIKSETANNETEHEIMVVGDFNLSAFSPIYRDFIENSGTNDKQLQRTTLNGLPTLLPFGIGIDHVLTTSNIDNVQTQAQGWQGSDHRSFFIKWQ